MVAVESVESDNRGFDLISRKPHPNDPKTFTDVRFIEVRVDPLCRQLLLCPALMQPRSPALTTPALTVEIGVSLRLVRAPSLRQRRRNSVLR